MSEGRCTHCGSLPPIWTPDKILTAIQQWAERCGRPPKASAWIQADYDHPARSTVALVFGTWNAAIAAAGFSVRRTRKMWTREEIVDAIQRWGRTHNGEPPRAMDFNGADDYPSRTAVIRTFGTWNAAIDEAGFFPREPNGAHRPCTDITLRRRVELRVAA